MLQHKSKIIVVILTIFLIGVVYIAVSLFSPDSLGSILSTDTKPGKLAILAPKEASINQPFQVAVNIDTQGQDVNAAGIYLRFDPGQLQLLSMDTSSSFCQFYPEKRYDQNTGTVSLACGSPHPGVNGSNQLIKLEFMPTKLGTSTIRTDSNSQLLLSDGRGDTNILESYPTASITILNTL